MKNLSFENKFQHTNNRHYNNIAYESWKHSQLPEK